MTEEATAAFSSQRSSRSGSFWARMRSHPKAANPQHRQHGARRLLGAPLGASFGTALGTSLRDVLPGEIALVFGALHQVY